MYMSINGKQVVHTAGIYAGDSGVFPVQKGDKVSLFIGSSGQGTPMAACYFIPPKTVNVTPDDPEPDLSYVHGQFAPTQSATVQTNSFKPLNVTENTINNVNSGLTVSVNDSTTGTKFTAQETGVYNVNFGRFRCNAGAEIIGSSRLVIRRSDSNGTTLEDVVQVIPEADKADDNTQWIEANMSYSVLLREGEYIVLGFYNFNPSNVNTNGSSTFALFTIAKL
jgi:hypothetical protein